MGVITNEEFKHKKSKIKWLILLLSILANFTMDGIGVLHDSFKEKFKHLGDDFEYYFNFMYAVYSLPNIILPFIGGVLITKYGNSLMYFIFGLLIFIGQIIFSYGIFYESIYTVLFGRFIYGLGGECLGLPQTYMIVKWFPTDQLALPFGLSTSGILMAPMLNNLITPHLAAEYDFNFAIRIVMYVSIATFTFTLINIFVDKKGDAIFKMNGNVEPIEKENIDTESCQSITIPEKITYKKLPAIYWFTCLYIVFSYGSYFSFDEITSGFLTESFFKDMEKKDAERKAGIYMCIPLIICCLFTPIFGVIIDKFGKRANITIIATLLVISGFTSFYFIDPIYGFIMNGISFSLTASVSWNIIGIVVKPEAIALANGIVTSLINLLLVINPLILATIYSIFQAYFAAVPFFIFLNSTAFIFAFFIYFEDKRKNNIINECYFSDTSITTKKLQTPYDIFSDH